jgi:phenylalanyl-tRNA synthetase alpha chain
VTHVRGVKALLGYTEAQKQRLKELMLEEEALESVFQSPQEREEVFKAVSSKLITKNKDRLKTLRLKHQRPALRRIESKLASCLTAEGFTEVITPSILAKGLLMRMNIHPNNQLWDQIFWVDEDHCLRPMLAPNLYFLLGHLSRIWPKPIRIFEVGSCFRKESKGAHHLAEFTMLNLVELAPLKDAAERLKELICRLMEILDIKYELSNKKSECYGSTLDVNVEGVEVGSGVVGPHILDKNWDVHDAWAGIGFGLERLIMAKEGFINIKRVGRSLVYLDGARLDIL